MYKAIQKALRMAANYLREQTVVLSWSSYMGKPLLFAVRSLYCFPECFKILLCSEY